MSLNDAVDVLTPALSLRDFQHHFVDTQVELVTRHLHSSKAAEELNVTRAAVSQQVKSLELQLNATLFVEAVVKPQYVFRVTTFFFATSNADHAATF